jgi:hypothetical protein
MVVGDMEVLVLVHDGLMAVRLIALAVWFSSLDHLSSPIICGVGSFLGTAYSKLRVRASRSRHRARTFASGSV